MDGVIKNKNNLFFLTAIIFFFSASSEAEVNLESLMSVLYSQTSGEIKATFVQTYNTANDLLDTAINDKNWDAVLESKGEPNRIPAIILDVDETVLDNTPFNARSIINHTSYPEGWDKWIYEEKATLIPGVKNFLIEAQNKGVRIFYVTNRRTVYEEATKNNIKNLGLPFDDDIDVLLTRGENGWGSSKASRRSYVSKKYRVIMMFGDNLNDFFDLPDKADYVTRKNSVAKHEHMWGSKWFMLANPVYGHWEQSIYGFELLDEKSRTKAKLDNIRVN